MIQLFVSAICPQSQPNFLNGVQKLARCSPKEVWHLSLTVPNKLLLTPWMYLACSFNLHCDSSESHGCLWGCSWKAGAGWGEKTEVISSELGKLSSLESEVCGYMGKWDVLTQTHTAFHASPCDQEQSHEKVKKNIFWKCSAQFGLVISGESDIASWSPTVLQEKLYQSLFSLSLWGE